MQKTPQTYSELLQATGMSSRTLVKALNRLQKEGVITRQIQANTDKYPPPVFYMLTPEGGKTLTPYVFATMSFWWAMGYKAESPKPVRVETAEGAVKEGVLLKAETLSLAEMFTRLFARAVYGLIKYFETKNIDWLNCTQTPLAINPFMLEFLGYKGEFTGFIKPEQSIQGESVGSLGFIVKITQEDIGKLKRQAEKLLKEEWRQLDMFYEASLKSVERLTKKEAEPSPHV